MEKKLIIFTDIGDTVIDESTEVRKVPFGVVLEAQCIPGARETLLKLHAQGYTIALVADGLEQSFRNTMQEHGLSHVFAAWVVSEPLGVEKPDQRMFETAMQRLGLTEADKQRVIMVFNDLARDMVGANRFGIRSVHMDWSPRYPDTARVPEETPTYTVHNPDELLPLVECLERQLEEKQDA